MKLLLLPLFFAALIALMPQQPACASANAASGQDQLSLAMDISKELRCPMATNQNLFESENPIASELKAQIYLMVNEGKSREQILDFMTQRYGEQIRYQPKLSMNTALLWGAPLMLFIGLLVLSLKLSGWRPSRSRSPNTPTKNAPTKNALTNRVK